MKFSGKMSAIKERLEKLGHKVLTPDIEEISNSNSKSKDAYIKEHMKKISNADAILVVNKTKNGIKNYIGANTFLEMGFAFLKEKKIYTLNKLPNQKYIKDELSAFKPIVLGNNFEIIG